MKSSKSSHCKSFNMFYLLHLSSLESLFLEGSYKKMWFIPCGQHVLVSFLVWWMHIKLIRKGNRAE